MRRGPQRALVDARQSFSSIQDHHEYISAEKAESVSKLGSCSTLDTYSTLLDASRNMPRALDEVSLRIRRVSIQHVSIHISHLSTSLGLLQRLICRDTVANKRRAKALPALGTYEAQEAAMRLVHPKTLE